MRNASWNRLFFRLFCLIALASSLVVLKPSVASADEACYYNCDLQAHGCRDVNPTNPGICDSSYNGCMSSCTKPNYGTCGRLKTQCDVACISERKECVADGRTDCGAAYTECWMSRCCNQ
jgi:hypothetical protein